jgi:hypothetical protein
MNETVTRRPRPDSRDDSPRSQAVLGRDGLRWKEPLALKVRESCRIRASPHGRIPDISIVDLDKEEANREASIATVYRNGGNFT